MILTHTRTPELERGFTLIEILVVVVIVAVLAAALTLAIGTAGGARQLQREAERLQVLLTYACEQSELTGRDLGLSLATKGYQFSHLQGDEWQPIGVDTLRARSWLSGIQAALANDGGLIAINDEFPKKPQVVCFSSGELTAFKLDLHLSEVELRYRLIGMTNGAIELQSEVARAH